MFILLHFTIVRPFLLFLTVHHSAQHAHFERRSGRERLSELVVLSFENDQAKMSNLLQIVEDLLKVHRVSDR